MALVFKNGKAFMTNCGKNHDFATQVGEKVLVKHFDNPRGDFKATVKDFTLAGLVVVEPVAGGFYGTGSFGTHAFISQVVVHPEGIELDR